MNERATTDVCILGGGLAGLTLALQLKEDMPDLSVVVLENRSHPVPEAAFKVGESSVEMGAHYFANVIGAADHIREHQLPKLGLRYFMPAGSNAAIERRLEFGGNVFLKTPSFQLDRGRFENYLGEAAAAAGVDFRTQISVRGVKINPSSEHEVEFKARGVDPETLNTRWVVDATGRASLLKSQLQLEEAIDHDVNSVWFRLKHQIKIDDWSDNVAWRARTGDAKDSRWLSTNHLMGEGYWVWLIPLASGSTSVGIVADARLHAYESMDSFEKSISWLEEHEPQCADVVKEHKDSLQDFIGFEDFSYACKQVYSGDRWCLTGEAGAFLDPFYSPGSDYIGISNTFITHLISLDQKGKNIQASAQFFNDIYFDFFHRQAVLYKGQYPIMRHPRIMPLKIIWDFAYYWSIPAFIFFQDKLCDLHMYASFNELLQESDVINREMQACFNRWNESVDADHEGEFLDVTGLRFMRRLNEELSATFQGVAFGEKLKRNVALLGTLAEEMKHLVECYEKGVEPSQPVLLLEGVNELLFVSRTPQSA